MIDAIRWLLAIEVIGLVFLPFSFWIFKHLPDRGFALSKTLGLVTLTFGTWIVGEFVPIAAGVWLPLAIMILGSAASWWVFGDDVLETWSHIERTIVIEECLFLIAFVGLSLLRAYILHPGISHTEQYMDMSILGASVRSVSYPPYDPWMSGHAMNYYYLGYVMYSLVTKLSGVLPTVAYNLAISTVFALVVSNAYSVGLALTKRLLPALAAPVFVALLGNWHAILIQIPHGDTPDMSYWFWQSSRIIGHTATSDATITEFPFFSFTLGDLHPHVMALPITILVIALGLSVLFDPVVFRLERAWRPWARLTTFAMCIGSLFVINSWDFPTYGVLVAGCLGAGAYINDTSRNWWRAPLMTAATLAVVSVLLYAPFYLRYRPPTHGFGWVTTASNPGEFLQIFGFFGGACVLLLGAYTLFWQPEKLSEERAPSETRSPGASALETGSAQVADSPLVLFAVVALMVLVLGLRFQVWVLLGLALVAVAAGTMLHRALNTDEPNRADAVALLLILLGSVVLAVSEVVYIRDVFDGTLDYRLNTVFKLDYQAWTLLGLAAAYALTRASHILGRLFGRSVGITVTVAVLVGALGGGVYTVLAPQSEAWGGTATSLDGVTALRDQTPQSADYGAIMWLRQHAGPGYPVVLEATGDAYQSDSARVSTFTGLPTVMGWADHEGQWRGADPEIQQRIAAIKTIYTTHEVSQARALLHTYGVRYVFAGSAELRVPGVDLAKFGRFMHVAYRDPGATIYTW